MSELTPLPANSWALLRGVSRSFYLSMRLLPAPLRAPVAVGYLLARATDTLADTVQPSTASRLDHLQTLAAAIEAPPGARAGIPALIASFAPLQQDAHERALILALPECLAWLDRLAPADQADVRTVLHHITQGQALDLSRFGAGGPVRALASAAELEDYTWRVAGCVGEFWTALGLRHLPSFAALPEARLRELGRSYGMGLQLVNILRDLGPDLAAGRCYLPADALAATGLAPQDIASQPAGVEALYRHWLDAAQGRLADGMTYTGALNSRRMRAASALPALVGARTLARLRAAGAAGALRQRIKVPRHEMRALLMRMVLGFAGREALAAQFRALGGSEGAAPMGQSPP
ncbi:MAG: squalene/phytoene synthase family protein [Ramlibacter sp.]|nr:squalene/phytoene synthase family protein [Ramlibacter sp.]